MNSYFHLYERGYYHDRVDVDVLAASTADGDDDLVALYWGYYDWSLSWRLYVLNLGIVRILV
jgi:hypothetical protein